MRTSVLPLIYSLVLLLSPFTFADKQGGGGWQNMMFRSTGHQSNTNGSSAFDTTVHSFNSNGSGTLDFKSQWPKLPSDPIFLSELSNGNLIVFSNNSIIEAKSANLSKWSKYELKALIESAENDELQQCIDICIAMTESPGYELKACINDCQKRFH